MKPHSIIQLAKAAENRPNNSIEIRHAKRESRYRVLGFIAVDINDVWVVHIQYQCKLTLKMYARTANNFHNFIELYIKLSYR